MLFLKDVFIAVKMIWLLRSMFFAFKPKLSYLGLICLGGTIFESVFVHRLFSNIQ